MGKQLEEHLGDGGEPSARRVLSASRLSRVFPSGQGLFEIDLRLDPGEVVGLMGPKGSGKSTLLRVLATADRPTSGSVSWFAGEDQSAAAVRRRLGVVLEKPAHCDSKTGYQNARLIARRFGLSAVAARARLDELFRWAGLWDARHQLVQSYSSAMKRKLSLVEALVHRPQLLLLDEPTLGLDYRSELDLIERIRLLSLTGTATLIATNDVHLAERICDRVLYLHGGRVVREGRVAELLTEVAGSKEVQLQLHSPISLESLRRVPSVEAVSVEGDTVHVVLARGANPAEVLAGLDGTADLVSNMRVRRPNLGDFFLRLTGVALPAG
jgi:ABC-type multidrug transport system ATPase subunit